MNAPILNRDFQHPADGWYMIEAKGEHPNAAANLVQVIDEDAINAIVNRFNADANAGKLKHGHEMLIDHEHFKHDSDKETVAYGWLGQLQNRADGIYGQVRWTATGKPAVDGGDYRFFSTEYDPNDLKILNAGKSRRVRPLRLDGLTLTNEPNNRGQKPITNRENNLPGAGASAANQPNKTVNKMKSIATKLGLSAEASEEAILAEVTKLQNRVTTLEPMEAENAKLKNRMKQLDDNAIAALLSERKITDEKIINRLKPVLAGIATHEERVATLDDFGFKAETKPTPQTKLHNRDTKPPTNGKIAEGENKQADQAKANKITNRAREIKKDSPGLTDATAFIMAQREFEQAENAS